MARTKEQTKEHKRAWRFAHRETENKRRREWYQQNRKDVRKYQAKYYAENYPAIKAAHQRWAEALREETFTHYGGAACVCCGESGTVFLSLDHINGGGTKQRREVHRRGGYLFYAILKRQGFPTGYQVLCMNCNFAKGMVGVCPHQAEVRHAV